MKDKLNVTKGEFTTNGLHVVKTGGTSIGQAFIMNFKHDLRGKSIADKEGLSNAQLWCNALNTYNTCQTLPSELLEQNTELIEVLEEVKKWYKRMWARKEFPMEKITTALKKIQQQK